MTNGEKYKTASERRDAYKRYVRKYGELMGEFDWLELEAEEELLPCPFCGGKASVSTTTDALAAGVVACDSCNCHIIEATKDEAVTAWNRRAK